MSKFSRKEFLKSGALSSLALGSGMIYGSSAEKSLKSQIGDAKNVIFLVSDGMSMGTLTLSELVKSHQFGQRTHWIDLYESPDREFHKGLMDMAPLNSVVTDSSAAASSWGCGHRINNGAVNMGPNGEKYRTILEIFRDAGKATGLVTTTRLTHATPSGFATNVPERGMEDEIALQYSERNYDLLMGGGRRHFDPDMRSDGQDLYQKMRNRGYTIATTKGELERSTGYSKLLGLFYDSHLPYSVDHKSVRDLQNDVPTLAEMTGTALDRLGRNENGFILQIEGGRVDHGAHGNDAAGMIYDQIAFDDAVKVVKDYTQDRDDTLVILTTDHGNANPGLSAHGSGYEASTGMMESLFDYNHSFEWINSELRSRLSEGTGSNAAVSHIREVVEQATSAQITEEEGEMIYKASRGEFRAPYGQRRGMGAVMSGVLANYNGIYFVSTSHTADFVEIVSWGPGSDRLPYFVRNTALFDLMVDMAGVREYAAG